jgi:hypothetical protein
MKKKATSSKSEIKPAINIPAAEPIKKGTRARTEIKPAINIPAPEPSKKGTRGRTAIRQIELLMLDDNYVSVRLLSARTGVNVCTLTRYCSTGKVETKRVNGVRYILINSYINEVCGVDAAKLWRLDNWDNIDASLDEVYTAKHAKPAKENV